MKRGRLRGFILSEETKHKISLSNTGKKRSIEQREADSLRKIRYSGTTPFDRYLQKRYPNGKGFRIPFTETDYNLMLTEQKDSCVLCSTTTNQNGRKLDVDHDHTTGKIRGLLCNRCNFAIGIIKEDANTAYNLYLYLKEHNG